MSRRPADPLSPVPGVALEGYTQETVLRAGESVEVMLSGGGQAEVSVERLIHGDPNPAGPGYRAQPAPWGGRTAVELGPQPLDLGSYLEISDRPTLRVTGSLTLAMWIYPTRLTGGWQALAAKWAPGDIGFGLFCVGNGLLAGGVSHDGNNVNWCAGRQFVETDAWQFVALIFDAEGGELAVHQHAPEGSADLERRHWDATPVIRSVVSIPSGRLHESRAPLRFGALAHPDTDTQCHWAHFDGKLASPTLLTEVADEELLADLEADRLAIARPTVLGMWDLSRDVDSSRIVDRSSYGHHGTAINRPARAVTGPRWAGTAASLYTDDPHVYDGVHLHSDDLADADWRPALRVEVPADARSGIYVVRVRSDTDALWLPLVIAPRTSVADLCVVVPTLTWQAYSSNRAPYSATEDGMVDQSLCIYDKHADGSPVLYTTRRKPTRAGDPTAGVRPWGAHTVPANLYLLDWLEHTGHAYDVLADQHLHENGHAALDSYRCIILGSHHEYWTVEMLDALESYLQGGGRCMYLSGNGLYWVTSLDAEQPCVMEVRKSGGRGLRGILRSPAARSDATQHDARGWRPVAAPWQAPEPPGRGRVLCEYVQSRGRTVGISAAPCELR